MADGKWMLYGAYGYTGTLIVEEAVRRGHTPLLAGRDEARLRLLAERLDLEWIALGLDDHDALVKAVTGVDLVLHAAGPYVHTAAPMLRACLAGIASYLDLTGEIPVLQNSFALSQAAWERGVALIPGVGFDVVPTDCLAVYVAAQVPDAVDLEIALDGGSAPSAGTVKSMLEMAPRGGVVRRGGRLVHYQLGQGKRRIRFSHGEREVLPIPWGDLATAYVSTGIPNITTSMAFPPGMMRWRSLVSLAAGLLANRGLRRWAQGQVGRRVRGPDADLRQTGRAYIWARAANASGNEAQAWLETVEGYRLTAETAVRCVEKTLAGHPRGACTPAQAFGADFILEFEGTRRYDALPG